MCGVLITLTVLRASEAPVRWMEADVLRFLGRISFSIYVWQQMLTGAAAEGLGGVAGVLLAPPVSLLWIVPVAWASYRWIELPGMRVGREIANC